MFIAMAPFDPLVPSYLWYTLVIAGLAARKVAEELAYDAAQGSPSGAGVRLQVLAQRYVEKAKRQAARGERNANYVRTATVALDNDDWGLVRHFATRDVRELKTQRLAAVH